MTRAQAAFELGRTGDPRAVPLLEAAFRAEPRVLSIASAQRPVRLDIVASLTEIRGPAADEALARILKQYLREGPRERRPGYCDWDYVAVVQSCLDAVEDRPMDDSLAQLLQRMAAGEAGDGKLSAGMQEQIHRVLIAHRLPAGNPKAQTARIKQLLSQLTGTGEGHPTDWIKPGVKTPEAARNTAIVQMVARYGSAATPAIQKALEATPAAQQERREALQFLLRIARGELPPGARR